MIRRPPRSTLDRSSAASDVYKRQGINEALFGNDAKFIFFLLFHFIGIYIALLGFHILSMLWINKNLSVFIIVFYLLTPATIVYENLFFYTHPIIFFLVFSCYNLLRYIKDGKRGNLFYLTLGLSFSVLTTSFFHLIWFISLLFLLWLINKPKRREIFLTSLIPFIILFALYFKNFIVFNQFNTSSWVGLNLSRITVQQLDKTTKVQLIEVKKISDASLLPPFTHFKDLGTFEKKYFGSNTGIDVLDQTIKESGRTNFNNYGYIKISNQVLNDDIYVMRNYPQVYLRGITKAFLRYFDSPTKYKLLTINVFRINLYNKVFDSFIYGSSSKTNTGYTTILLTLLILVGSFYLLFKSNSDFILKAFLIFALFNILYVMFVGNFLEYGENNRFRYYTEIFTYLLFAIILNKLFLKIFITNSKARKYEHSRTNP